MRFYFSGDPPIAMSKVREFGIKNFLVSYFYHQGAKEYIENCGEFENIFLDSGAFSAMNSGKIIKLESYIKFIHEVGEYVTEYAGLDVIGDPVATRENILSMEGAGLSPIPTFHIGSDIKYLHEIIERFDHFALGGMAGSNVSTSKQISFLDIVFREIWTRKPTAKVHGFACSGIKVMKRYPWYSVDSTSWLGAVIFARPISGEPSKKILYEQKLPNKKLEREFLLKKSIQEYLNYEAQVNEYHLKQDWGYNLTCQQELF